MKIKTVGYGRVVNVGNYKSIKYYLEAEVEPFDTWKNTLNTLAELIDEVEADRGRSIEVVNSLNELERTREGLLLELNQIEARLRIAGSRWLDVAEILRQKGFNPMSVTDEGFVEPAEEEKKFSPEETALFRTDFY